MRYAPHDYQAYAIDYIETHPVATVFLDMGLGKTSITLTAISNLLFDSFEVHRVLVIAPLRVARDTWTAEVDKWDHLQNLICSVAVGTEAQRRAAFMRPADIYIINRENVQWLVEESGIPFTFDMIVIDELSSFKNHNTKRFKSILKVRPRVSRIVGLTGTPASNGLMDLWAEFRILDMGQRLGRFITKYRTDYFMPDKRNGQIIYSYKPLPYAEDAIYRQISDITISMKSTDHLKMPKLVNSEYTVQLSDEEREHYDELKRELVLTLSDGEITAANAASLSGKLSQMANGAIYDDNGEVIQIHDCKLDALEDIIEAANGKPVLVAYWFKHDLTRISERLKKLHIPFSHLDDSDSIRRWNNGEIPVALIHPASAGHGLNLQSGGSTLICQSNVKTEDLKRLYSDAKINPLGDWTGGTDVDTGATNRKLGSDMADSVTGGGLHGKDLSKADVSVNIYAFLKARETGKPISFCCAIGDDTVDGRPYAEIVEIARRYIIDTMQREEFGISSCSLYRGIDLIYSGFRGNMSHYEEVTKCQEQ